MVCFYANLDSTKVPTKSNSLTAINYNINDPRKYSTLKMFTGAKIKIRHVNILQKPIFSSFPSEHKEPRRECPYLPLTRTLTT